MGPFRVQRDIAAFNSSDLDSILPFSEKTDTVDTILMRGMRISVLSVPVYKVNLDCELVQGEVAVPVEGIDMFLTSSCV